MSRVILAALAGAAFMAISPASAATFVSDCNAPPPDIQGGYPQTCAGYFQGNLLDNSAPDVADQISALNSLGFNTAGFNFNSFIKLDSLSSQTINFGVPLSGITYFAVHYGAGQPSPSPGTTGGVTAFYRVDFGSTPVTSFTLQFGAQSDAVLYGTGRTRVPEPATWAMMLGGFGLLGAVARRRHRTSVTFA